MMSFVIGLLSMYSLFLFLRWLLQGGKRDSVPEIPAQAEAAMLRQQVEDKRMTAQLLAAVWRQDVAALKAMFAAAGFRREWITHHFSHASLQKLAAILLDAIAHNDQDTLEAMLPVTGYCPGLAIHASRCGNVAALAYLLENFPEVADEEVDGRRPLEFALNPQIVQALLAHGADPDYGRDDAGCHDTAAENSQDSGSTPVKTESVAAASELPGDPHSTSIHCETPLLDIELNAWALSQDAPQEGERVLGMIESRIAHGADIHAQNSDGTLLHKVAAYFYNEMTVDEAGARVFEKMIRRLVQLGADVNARNEEGDTPLHCAQANQWGDCCSLPLLSCGADIDAQNNDGATPLMAAIKSGAQPSQIEFLLSRGADADLQDGFGWTALHHAAQGNYQQAAQLLLRYGANATILNEDGRSAWQLAEGHSEMVACLRSAEPPAHPEIAGKSDAPAAADAQPRFTEQMVYRLKSMAQYPRHYCFRCGQRNSIENVFFCLDCGEILCWQCIHQREKKIDPFDGKMHHVCRCGNFLKLWDEWDEEAMKVFPDPS